MSQVTARQIAAAKVAGRQITGTQIGVPTSDTTFTSVWATTAINETITIPAQNVGTFNALVDWGDGTASSTITAYNDADLAHVYATAGDHTIKITGSFPNIYFNNAGDRLKIKRVTQLGQVGWTRFNAAFLGCANLTEFTVGSTDTSSVTTMQAMFADCNGLTTLDLSSFNTTNVTSMASMFSAASALTSLAGVEDFDITGLNSTDDLSGFLTSGSMTTAQYDNLLVKWEAQVSATPSIPAMTASFGGSIHSPSPAAGAVSKFFLVVIYGWTIEDGVTP